MSMLMPSSFCNYRFSDEEQEAIIGSFTESQRQFIQSQISALAEELLALTYDSSDPQAFIQRQAYLRGQIDFAKYLQSFISIPKEY